MQKKDGNKNLLRPNAWNQRQQIKPRRDIKDRRVRDQIYCEDAIENAGHLSLLPNRLAFLNSIVTPSAKASQLSTLIYSRATSVRSRLSLVTCHFFPCFFVKRRYATSSPCASTRSYRLSGRVQNKVDFPSEKLSSLDGHDAVLSIVGDTRGSAVSSSRSIS